MTRLAPHARGDTRVLVVEDEYLLATDLAERLEANGVEVVGPIGTLPEALETAGSDDFDGAIVDIDLRGVLAYPLLDLLIYRDIPTIVTTGFDRCNLPTRFRGMTIMLKPCDPETVHDRYDMERLERDNASAPMRLWD